MSARGQTQSFSWEMSRRGTHNKRGPRKFLIFGERRKCGKPNSHREFHLASHFRRGPPMMSKTVLDLLHSLGVEDDMIMFDNFGG